MAGGNQPGWQVVASGGQGTDTLTGVEKVTDGTGHSFLLVGSGGFATIQAAVDAAVNGDTILIAAGPYREQVSISGKDITLQGAGVGQTIIELPDSAALVESYHESNSGLPYRYSVVTVKGNSDVTITGVTVDGRDQGNISSAPGAYNFAGVYVINSDAHIDGIAVTNVRELVAAGPKPPATSATTRSSSPATARRDTYHVEIENSTISNFQKTGIFANGPGLTVDIHDNPIIGTHTAFQTQNGMQIGSAGAFAGTAGTIHNNTITDIGFNDPDHRQSEHGRRHGHPGLSRQRQPRDRQTTMSPATRRSAANPNYSNNGIVFTDSDGGNVHGNTISGFDNAHRRPGRVRRRADDRALARRQYLHQQRHQCRAEPFPAGTTRSPSAGRRVTTTSPARRAVTRSPGLAATTRSHGGVGNDTLDGGAGADTLIGGTGNDTYVVDNAGDVVTETSTKAPTRCSRRSPTRSAPMSRT